MRQATFATFDYNPGATNYTSTKLYSSPDSIIGFHKTFIGERGGKFLPRVLKLRNVTIAERTGAAHTIRVQTGNHPVWGSRAWEGEIGGVLFEYGIIERDFPAFHEQDRALQSTALQRAYANVDKASFDGQLFLAELGETIAMLRDPLRTLKIFLARVKTDKRVLSRIKNAADVTAGTYLQYMFGIVPIIQDIQNAFEAWEKVTVKSSFLRSGGSVRKVLYNQKESYSLTGAYGCTSLKYDITLETRHDVFGRVYYYHLWENAILDMVNKWGFNPIMLPIVAWQRVPLSFVFDWFACVTLWMRAMAPKPNVEYLGNCVSEKFVETYRLDITEMKVTVASPPITTYGLKDDGFNEAFIQKIQRLIRVVNLPVPTGVQWGNGIDSLGKAVSSLALTWQRLSNSPDFKKHFRDLQSLIARRT